MIFVEFSAVSWHSKGPLLIVEISNVFVPHRDYHQKENHHLANLYYVYTNGLSAYSMGEEISLSLEETNRLRVSIGLKPIPIPENVKEKLLSKRDVAVLREFEPPRKRAKVPPVANQYVDEEPQQFEDMSTLDFLSQLDKVAADNEASLLKEPAEPQEAETQIHLSHTAADLAAMGTDAVLTLEDKSIFDGNSDDDGEVLVNENIARQEKSRAHEEEKRKIAERHHRKFGGFAEDELENDNEEQVSKGIRIVSQPSTETSIPKENGKESLRHMFENEEELEETQPKSKKTFKKIKKKDKKSTKKSQQLSDLFDEDLGDVPSIQEVKLESFDDAGLEEDEEFSNLMSLQRRRKQKIARGKMQPEDIAREIKQIKRKEELEDDITSSFGGGITYDDNSEFLNSLSANILQVNNEHEQAEEPVMGDDGAILTKIAVEEKLNSSKQNNEAVLGSEETVATKNEDAAEKEEVIGDGIGSTLKLLRQRNIIQAQDEQRAQREREQRIARRKAELVRFQISVEERVLEEELSKDKSYRKLSKEEKEKRYETLLEERLQAKNLTIGTSTLTSYNPKVTLLYLDDEGKELDTKGAFKHLSHKFHGSKKR